MGSLLGLLISPKVKGIASIAGAALMFILPNEFDTIIEGLLGAFGISKLIED